MSRQPNRTKHALLGFLTWGPMSGYDLQKVVTGSISNFWQESYGRIYPMLAQLSSDGLASMREETSSGGRPRKVYSITEAGRDQFEDWLHEPAAPRPLRNEMLLKLFFGARTNPSRSRELVIEARERAGELITHYASIQQQLEAAKDVPDRQYWLMTLRYGQLEAQAHLDWCEETLEKLPPIPEDPA
jgi:DNA-binding PadR family transcriptional regulator